MKPFNGNQRPPRYRSIPGSGPASLRKTTRSFGTGTVSPAFRAFFRSKRNPPFRCRSVTVAVRNPVSLQNRNCKGAATNRPVFQVYVNSENALTSGRRKLFNIRPLQPEFARRGQIAELLFIRGAGDRSGDSRPGHQPGQLAWGHLLAIGTDRKIAFAASAAAIAMASTRK